MFTMPTTMFPSGMAAVDLHSGRFNGSNQSIYAADSAALSMTDKFTAQFYARVQSLPAIFQTEIIASKWESTGNQASWTIGLLDQGGGYKLSLDISQSGSTSNPDVFVLWTPTLNVWYQISVAYEATGAFTADARFYIDSVDQGVPTQGNAGNPTSIFDSTAPLEWGGSDGGASWAHVDLCEMRLWHQKLTQPQIAANYNQVVNPLSANLDFYCHPELAFTDVSVNAAVINQRGAPTIITDVPF